MSWSAPTVIRLMKFVEFASGVISSLPKVVSSQWARTPACKGTPVAVVVKIELYSRRALAPTNVSPTIQRLKTLAPGVNPKAWPISWAMMSRSNAGLPMSAGSRPVMPA
jgi:hypothetical protein